MSADLEIQARGIIAVHPPLEARLGEASGTAALRGLDLEVRRGEIAAVVGPSGSGKTTLLRLLAGLERPTAGSLVVHGLDLGRAPAAAVRIHRREAVGVVDQHYRRALSPYLPAREIVALPLAMRGSDAGVAAGRAADLLAAVGLDDRGAATLGELSGGEQQRVAVAAALATRPAVLLADEPTGELDATSTTELLRLIRAVVRAEGATAVIVTHDPAVEAIADRVVVLEDGRAVAARDGGHGTPEVPLVDAAGWHAPEVTWRHRATDGRPTIATGSRPAAPAAAAPAVRLRGVTRRYGGTSGRPLVAIEDLDARIAARGVHAIVGPSGSGKSTLLRLVAGLDRPDGGTVEVLGVDLASLDREGLARFRAAHIGVAEQARGLVPFLDVRENLALAASLRASEARPGAADVEAVLEDLGLSGLGGRRPHELSAGERTRVAIGRALATRPRLLLLDEPTATLDRVTAARIATLLRGLARDRAVVVATHDPALIDVADDRLELRPAAAAARLAPVEVAAR